MTTKGLISRYLVRQGHSKLAKLFLRKLALDVDGVEPRDEVDQDLVHAAGHLFQEGLCDFLVGGVLGEINRNEQLLGLGIDVADVDAAFVGEVDPVALANLVVSARPLKYHDMLTD
jgi:hypothetical protein